mmetsp:Transcript_1321/g.2761  ORF Transcript_1321/g.2761 Transcript_1321/m.2761 type:complete len:167 (+) Transcript_1321:84-584(+)
MAMSMEGRLRRGFTVTETNRDLPLAVVRDPAPVLRLRRRGIRWTADTHDNEHENKRKSKNCCIFHRKRAFGESSSESSVDPEQEHEERKQRRLPSNHGTDCRCDSATQEGLAADEKDGQSCVDEYESDRQVQVAPNQTLLEGNDEDLYRDNHSSSSSSSGGPTRSQ